MSDLRQRVIHIISTLATVPEKEIGLQDRLREDLGMDSITSMELISALAEDLGLEVEVEEAVGASTVNDVLELARARLSGAARDVAG